MDPYRYTSGEVYGEQTPDRPSPLPPVTAGDNLRLRARRAKTDPTWRERSKESKEILLRADAASERELKRIKGDGR